MRLPATALLASGAVVLLAAVNLPTLWNGTYVDALLRRPSSIPAYWHAAADALSASGDGTRALELPGAEFAAYRWGTTNDAILPGLTDRPTLTRDLLPLGGAAMMDLLDALDDRFQNGTIEPASIAPVARLLGAGAIVYPGRHRLRALPHRPARADLGALRRRACRASVRRSRSARQWPTCRAST